MKQGWTQMEQTLSCLSCLEFLGKDNPWTLLCGHSICNKVSDRALTELVLQHALGP